MLKKLKIIIVLAICSVSAAVAADGVKIGMITTLSTKAGYLGEEIRDGFRLAMDGQDGKLGGVEVELLVEDDARKPERGKQSAERYIKRENIKIITGIVFSNVAVVPKVVRSDVFYISPNAGPSKLAGSGCHENYFNVAWQEEPLPGRLI
jgi:branched-chain amino acid transport system substrate-binding protein